MSLKIGFLTTLGVNVGDEFIREGVRAALTEAGADYTPMYVNKHEVRSLHAWAADETVAATDKFWECDLFLQCGAPVYWWLQGGAATSLNSEWHQWMWEDRLLASRPGPVFANLGAGSCQPWGEGPERFLADAGCADFARRAGARAELTTVRDPLAGEILAALGVSHRLLGCPAVLAAARHRFGEGRESGPIGLNLMPKGGHWDLEGGFDEAAWAADGRRLAGELRRLGPLCFFAHDAAEEAWLSQLAEPGERVFLASAWRDYLEFFAACSLVVANRVHGAVCAAGFGTPALIIGNDSRAQIGAPLGLPIFRSGHTPAEEIAAGAAREHAARRTRRDALLTRRGEVLRCTAELLAPVLALAEDRARS